MAEETTQHETKAKSKSSGKRGAQHQEAPGAEELQDRWDEAQDQGFFGDPISTIPNEEFALTTGPDSPSAAEQMAAGVQRRADRLTETAEGK